MKTKDLLRKTKRGLVKHGPAILFGMGLVGVGVTVVAAVVDTKKADEKIEAKKDEKAEDTGDGNLTKMEVVKVAAPCYFRTALAATTTYICLYASHKINVKRLGHAVEACSMYSNMYKKLETAAKEELGEKGYDKILDKRAEVDVRDNDILKENIVCTSNGPDLIFDELSGRYFLSSIENVKRAVNVFNERISSEMWMNGNEWFNLLDLPSVEIFDSMGWQLVNEYPYRTMDVSFGTKLTSDNRPCCVIIYNNLPVFDDRYRPYPF